MGLPPICREGIAAKTILAIGFHFHRLLLKLDFVEFPVIANPNSRSLRASAHTGVAISRIEAPLLVDELRKTAQKGQTV